MGPRVLLVEGRIKHFCTKCWILSNVIGEEFHNRLPIKSTSIFQHGGLYNNYLTPRTRDTKCHFYYTTSPHLVRIFFVFDTYVQISSVEYP